MLKRIFLYVFVLLMFPFYGIAQQESACFPKAQNPPKLVNDFASVLSPQVINTLEHHLVNFNDTTSTQIAIVTLNDLCGYEASQFAYAIGETWGVGNKQFNNGIVILVKPKIGNEFGDVFIATGYGLEGVLPDAVAKRIIENEMIPSFRNEDYEGGIVAAATVIMDITGGEYSANDYNNRHSAEDIPLFPLFIILFIMFLMFAKTLKRARQYATKNNVSLWMALMLLGSMNNRHSGYYNNFSSGRGRFGRGGSFGGGGGFGGFGGGSFGGGGAGGRW